MSALHKLPSLCRIFSSRKDLAEAFALILQKNSEVTNSIDDHIILVRLCFFLKCLYMNGKVDNTRARDEVLWCYRDIRDIAIKYLQDFHNTPDKEVDFIQQQSQYQCPVLQRFEREALKVGDLQRYRDKTQGSIAYIMSSDNSK